MLGHLPENPDIHWSADGVRTHRSPVDVVRVLRSGISDDLEHGRVELESGWGLARTELILLQLAAVSPRLTADASRP
ncbi:MAG: hypothetical protein GIKADHBN_02665 [Phycisphaerales bacterium]|nr:hypothetical protein [Phycisphaerales bacterium]MCK6476554.1 hypothetical protein [Phycisphaerales bacterium]